MIGFLHVPKTGGTALRTAFEAAGRVVWRPRGPRYTLDAPTVDLTGVDVATGHLGFGALVVLAPAVLVTVLREPVERWLSHYFAEASERGGYPDPGVVPDNLTCRLLCRSFDPDPAEAAATLARFDHVGDTADLDATFTRFGLAPMVARRSPLKQRSTIPDWVLDAAVDANRADLALYNDWRARR